MTDREFRAWQGQIATGIRELKTRVKIPKETTIIKAEPARPKPETVRRQIKL